ncbi:hypothetical protein BHE74_00046893 [Ensete ventricosum]|nr:hypothetical protein BHE74_00046893 [Ensete ventricosum]
MARLLIGAAAYDQGPLWAVTYGQGCLQAIAYGGAYGHNTHGQAVSRPGGHARRPSTAHSIVTCVGATTAATRTRAMQRERGGVNETHDVMAGDRDAWRYIEDSMELVMMRRTIIRYGDSPIHT